MGSASDTGDSLSPERPGDAVRPGLAEPPRFVGNAPAIHAARAMIEKVRDADATVSVVGPTGSGKEVVARLLHYGSRRASKGRFIAHNCGGGTDSSLLESLLFGHEKGAFTGATSLRRGLVELAHAGTLFLDEIQFSSLALQESLLRTLQEHEFLRVGGQTPVRSAFRLVIGTSRQLIDLLREGRLHEAFYFRVKTIVIELPSLRQRREDIPALLDHFNGRESAKWSREPLAFSPESIDALLRYPWPGNVRELEHEVERLHTLCARRVEARDLSVEIRTHGRSGRPTTSRAVLDRTTRALEACGGDVGAAARSLGIHRTTLWRRRLRL